MGHSLGGAICFLYAAVFPDDVDHYISFDMATIRLLETEKITESSSDCIDKLLKLEDPIFKNQIAYSYEDMIALVHDAYKGALARDECEIVMKRGSKLSENGEGYVFRRDPRLKVAALGTFAAEHVSFFLIFLIKKLSKTQNYSL